MNEKNNFEPSEQLLFDSIQYNVCNLTAKLLDSGIDANAVGKAWWWGAPVTGMTALFVAVSNRFFDTELQNFEIAKLREPCIETLLDHGADVNKANPRFDSFTKYPGMTPLTLYMYHLLDLKSDLITLSEFCKVLKRNIVNC